MSGFVRTPIIQRTYDHEKFKKHSANRDLKAGHLKQLESSILEINLLMFNHILIDEQWGILDGQHRFEVCKRNNLEVFYIIVPNATAEMIRKLNANQSKWFRKEFLASFIESGNENYIQLVNFCEKNSLTLPEFAYLCPNFDEGRYASKDPFIDGKFGFPTDKNYENLKLYTDRYKESYFRIVKVLPTNQVFLESVRFKKALISFIKHEQIKSDTFLHKIDFASSFIHGCADAKSYENMFLKIYNWKSKYLVAL